MNGSPECLFPHTKLQQLLLSNNSFQRITKKANPSSAAQNRNKKQQQPKKRNDSVELYVDAGTPAATIVLLAKEHSPSHRDLKVSSRPLQQQKQPTSKSRSSAVQLSTPSGLWLDQAAAVAMHLCSDNPDFTHSSDPKLGSEVLQWVSFARDEAHYALCSYLHSRDVTRKKHSGDVTKKATAHARRVLQALDNCLSGRTFLVGERLSLADAAVLAEVGPLLEDLASMKETPHLLRWANTCAHQNGFKKVLGEPKVWK